jgi:cytochrome c oxidase subunit 3
MAWAVRAAQLGQRRILQLMLVLTLVFAGGFLGVKYVEYNHKWQHGLLWAAQFDPDEHTIAKAHGGDHAEGEHGQDLAHPQEGHDAAGHDAATGEAANESAASGDGDVMDAVSTEPGNSPAPLSATDRSNFAPAASGPSGLATEEQRAEAVSESKALNVDPKDARTFFSIYFMMTGLHGIHVVLGMAAMVWLLVLAGRGVFDSGHATRVDTIGLYWHLVDLIWIYLFLLLYLIH